MSPRLALRAFRPDDLLLVEPWFDEPETQRWLGGRDWPAMALRLPALLPRARTFLAWADERPAVLLGFDVEDDGRAGLAFVTDPRLRRQGHATAALRLLLPLAVATGARRIVAGVEAGNWASEALVRRAGFRPEGERDAEGFTYFGWDAIAST